MKLFRFSFNSFKKTLVRALSALLMFSMVSQGILAYADYTSYEIQQVAYSYVKKYSIGISINNTEISLLNSLNNITRFYMWVDYMCNVDPNIAKFTDNEKSHYSSILYSRIKTFNETFAEPNGFTGLQLPLFEEGSYPNDMQGIINSVSVYIKDLYSKHTEIIKNLSTKEEKDTYYNDNRNVLDTAYLIILRLQQDYSFINSAVPFHTTKYPYKLNLAVFSQIISSTSEYKEILDYVIANLERTINTDTDIKLSEGNNYIDKFSRVDENGEKEEVINNAYLVAFAASSLYMPIESKIGENYVIEAINHLAEDEEVARAYTEIAEYKKPLYLRSYNGENAYGSGEAVTLGEFLKSVLDRKSGALVTIEGKFQLSADGDSYESNTSDPVTRYESGSMAGSTVKEEDEGQNPNGEDLVDEENPDNTGEKYYDETTGKLTVLGDVLSEGSNFSEPLLVYGRSLKGNTNTAVISNYYVNNALLDLDGELANSSALYVNPFGDIILSDNTVVVPAAANATYYSDDDSVIYNPFTEMFMAGYPQINDGLLYETEDKNKNSGKYVFSTSVDVNSLDSLLSKCLVKMDSFNSDNVMAHLLNSKNLSLKTGAGLEVLTLDTGFYTFSDISKSNIFIPEDKKFSGLSGLWDNFTTFSRLFYRLNSNIITADGVSAPLYPYGNSEGLEAIIRAKYLVESFYLSMVSSEEGVVNVNSGRINDKLLYKTLVVALDGKPNVNGHQSAFSKSILDSQSKGMFYFIIKFFKDFANVVVNVFEDTPGMLGVRPANQDYIMGNFLYYARLSMGYIFVIAVLVILGVYLRRRVSIFFTLFTLVGSLFLIFSSIYFFPKHVSSIANFFVSSSSNEIAFKTLAMRQEGNTGRPVQDSTFEGLGTFNFATSSINIYKMYDEDIEYLCNINGVDYGKILSGGALILDEETGLYIEGDSLKMNLDKFFDITSIVSRTDTVGNLATYTLEVEKNIPSVIDYYMPYTLIMKQFVSRLNEFSSIYQIPRDQNNYGNDYWKDSFLMEAFIHSPLFLAPENYREADSNMSDSLYEQLVSVFGENNVDFLGISDILNDAFNRGENREQETLWYNTMLQNGYFQETAYSAAKFKHLVEYVNLQVKDFLIKNKDYFIYMSDENVIELCALWAVMSFNNEVKEFGNVLYPQTLNFHAYSVVDILKALVVTDMNKFAVIDRSLVDYIASKYSIMGLFAIIGIILFTSLSSILINASVYILYLMLLVFILIRFIVGKKVNEPLKGFLKVLFAISVITYVNIAGTKLIVEFFDSGLNLFFLLLLSSLTFGFICAILYFVITGLGSMDFGNTNVTSTIKSIKDKLNPFNRDKIHAAKLTATNIKNNNKSEYNLNFDDNLMSSIALDNFLKGRYGDSAVTKESQLRERKFKRRKNRSVDSQSFSFIMDDEDL